jgi:plastocyanin
MRHAILAALLAGALLAGCGGSGTSDNGAKSTPATSSSAATAATKFTIRDFLFSPTPATVKVGQKLSVTNDDAASHTFTDKGTPTTFDSGTVKHGQTRTVTFTKAGTFKIYCQFHPTMSGTVTVTT